MHAPHSARCASELGASQPQLVAERRGQRFLLQHVDATLLAIDRERDQSLDAARCRRLLAEHRRGAPEVCSRGHRGSRRNDTLDEVAARDVPGCVGGHRLVFHGQATSLKEPSGDGGAGKRSAPSAQNATGTSRYRSSLSRTAGRQAGPGRGARRRRRLAGKSAADVSGSVPIQDTSGASPRARDGLRHPDGGLWRATPEPARKEVVMLEAAWPGRATGTPRPNRSWD